MLVAEVPCDLPVGGLGADFHAAEAEDGGFGKGDALEVAVPGEEVGGELGEIGLVSDDEAAEAELFELGGDGEWSVEGGEAVFLRELGFELEPGCELLRGFVGSDEAALPNGVDADELVFREAFDEAVALLASFGGEGSEFVAGSVVDGVGVAQEVEVLEHWYSGRWGSCEWRVFFCFIILICF